MTPTDETARATALGVAQVRARIAGRNVSIADLLDALFGQKTRAIRLLTKHGSSRYDLRRYLAHGIAKAARAGWLPRALVVRMPPGGSTPHGECHVVLENDDFTSQAFVVDLLCSLFGKTAEEATSITMSTQELGRAVVAACALKTALRKVAKAERRAEKAGFPLRLTIEPAPEHE